MIKIKRIKFKKDKVCKACTKVSFLLLTVSLFLQVVITNKYAIKGGEMAELQDNQFFLEKEVSLLKLEISEVSSLALIEESSRSLGFVDYNEPIAVISSSQFAALPSL